MRRCPYCAEEIQDAAVICRFCGRDVALSARARLPAQGWYQMADRVKTVRKQPEPLPRTSLWAKIGGIASEVLEPRELKPNRSGSVERLTRRYKSLPEYQAAVARLTEAGWLIERQTEPEGGVDGPIEVSWVRQP